MPKNLRSDLRPVRRKGGVGGELQALRCKDLDFGGHTIHVEKRWDQEEDKIEPKSPAAKCDVPLVEILQGNLESICGQRVAVATDSCLCSIGRAGLLSLLPGSLHEVRERLDAYLADENNV